MRYRAKHQAQLGAGTPVPGGEQGSRDCGPRSWSVGMDAQTRGRIVPSVDEARRRANVRGPQQTNVYDWQRATLTYTGGPKYKPMRYYIKRRVSEVKQAVRMGRAVQICIHYGVFNDLMKRTGDPNFRGGHGVTVTDQKTLKNGTVRWLLYDSLDDKRRAGIPQGWRWVDRDKLVKAMIAFGGSRNSIFAGVFAGGQKKK